MGAHAREYLMLKMYRNDYDQLSEETKEMMEIRRVDIEGFDYSKDKLHKQLKKESTEAYRKLKDRETDLRLGND